MFKLHVRTYFKQSILTDQIHLQQFETLIFHDMATIRPQVYNFGVESFTDGWIRKQCNLANRFPNVFVQGLNLAKNRPTSLIWTDYTTRKHHIRVNRLALSQHIRLQWTDKTVWQTNRDTTNKDYLRTVIKTIMEWLIHVWWYQPHPWFWYG